jgi:hypothetical protein
MIQRKPVRLNQRQTKYHNKKTCLGSKKFDSVKEKNIYLLLLGKVKSGEIWNLERQVKFELQPHYRNKQGKMEKAITYIADFTYYDSKGYHVVDVKSEITRKDKVYRIKKKILGYQKGIDIEEM